MLLQYGFVDVEFVATGSDTGRANPLQVQSGEFGGDNDWERKGTTMHAFYARKAHT